MPSLYATRWVFRSFFAVGTLLVCLHTAGALFGQTGLATARLQPPGSLSKALNSGLQPFAAKYCHDCHADGAAEGGLALEQLSVDLSDEAAFASWTRVFDRITLKEMPPVDAKQPTATERSSATQLLSRELTAEHQRVKGTVLRRLNRREYENTLNDIFGTHLDLASLLPEDGRASEFDNVGASLSISMVQLQQYLDAIDRVLDAATEKSAVRPEPTVKNASYADTREAEKHLGKAWYLAEDGAVVFYRRLSYPTGMLRDANTRQAGQYRIKVTGYAYQSAEPITFEIGATTFQRGAERPTFSFHEFAPGQPQTIEIEAWIEDRYMVEITPWGIGDPDYLIKKHGIENYQGPGLAILNVELTGPLRDEFPSRGHRLLFDAVERVEVEPSNPSHKSRPWYVPTFEIRSNNARQDALRSLERVATAAFRRPVDAELLESYVNLFETEVSLGQTFEQALKTSVAAIFCSPDFLFLHESDGWLDAHALASRLSYFLTRTTPDTQLRESAASGRLQKEPQELMNQTSRLLADARFERFVVDFADAWLNLRDIDFTSPDQSLFPEYDSFLQFSMLEETRAFLRILVEDNLSVRNLVQSDFALLNERLADHYGIPSVSGPWIRRVELPSGSCRGGFLSQASVLKVSANGTNTSPIVRGVWVMERILGQSPPPPPPGIAGVEPDIRGATTLRELLDKHRDSDTCRSCHAVIDPPGFALESFNPIGGYRERFRSLGEGEKVNLQIEGRRVRYKLGQPVDASGELADGSTFENFQEFRERLASEEEVLARAFATKLLTFATGREMGFSDRPLIDEIVAQSRERGYGVRDLIELVVSSQIFRRK